MTIETYMDIAKGVTALSEDNSRKTACIFVDATGCIRASGHNHFPAGVERKPERLQRPAKYLFTEHAERNAIYSAARAGVPLAGCVAYLPWFPCCDCARALVGAGTSQLVCYAPDWNDTRYNFVEARIILEEGAVQIVYLAGSIGEPQ